MFNVDVGVLVVPLPMPCLGMIMPCLGMIVEFLPDEPCQSEEHFEHTWELYESRRKEQLEAKSFDQEEKEPTGQCHQMKACL